VVVAGAVDVPTGKAVALAVDEGLLIVLVCVKSSGTAVVAAAVGAWMVVVPDVPTAVSIVVAADGMDCEQLLSHTSDNKKNKGIS
jgi:hypothetical protein